MPSNQDTLIRQWHMLRLMPRYPQKATVQSIRSSLMADGYEVTERTVQRDLNELSSVFPLMVDDRDKPYGWSWQKDAPNFSLPGLTIPEALTLTMAEQHLAALIPVTMMNQLNPYFEAARNRLNSEPRPHRGRSWLDKVRTVPPSQPLIPPKISAEVQSVITEALFHERQVEIEYRKDEEKKIVQYRIHPLALVQRGPVLYLYCRIFDYEDARTLAMHRITSAVLLEDTAIYPKGFSLDKTVDSGVWNFGAGNKLAIKLHFAPYYGDHLLESPLSKDQSVIAQEDGSLVVSATVADTPQLRWWLMGFGSGVKVISPEVLRSTIRDEMVAAAKEYGV